MKKVCHKITLITLVIALCLGFSSVLGTKQVYGQTTFKDVTGVHWAYNYIQEVAKLNIVNGFPDGNFLPESPVTKEESLAMVYRTLEKSIALKAEHNFTEEYKDILTQHGIAEWAKPYVAYGLKIGILDPNELQYFVHEELGVPATREEVAVWTARGIKKLLSPIVDISVYGDTSSIKEAALPYIDMLYRYEIMMGDNYNNFRPKSTITRAEFATICFRTSPLAGDSSIVLEKNGATYKGIIEDIQGNTVTLREKNNNLKKILFLENKGIIINGTVRTLSYLSKGAEATISYNNRINEDKVFIDTLDEVYKGKINSIEKIIENDYILKILNEKGLEMNYWLSEKSDLYDENGDEIKLITLTSGRNILYTCDGIKILELQIQK
jgi:hypothetical protein